MVINERCINILSLLNETKELTLKKLSENFKVHSRTIRYDIENINYILKSYNFNQIEKYESGVFVLNLKSSQLNLIINEFGGISSEHRKSYLKFKIFSKDIVNLTKEAELLGVSRTTLKKDLDKIKEEFNLEKVEIKEIPSKGIKLIGIEDKIHKIFEEELYRIIKKDFSNLPICLKDTVGKIVGDIDPQILKKRMKDLLKSDFNSIDYNKIFCKFAVISTRRKVDKKILGYDIEYMNNFINSIEGERFILDNISIVLNKEEKLKFEKEKLGRLIQMLEIDESNFKLEIFFKDIKKISEEIFISEKVCETNFYKYFFENFENSKLLKNELQGMFYVLYNEVLLKEYNNLKNMKVLYISDDSELVKTTVIKKIKNILNFKKVDKLSTHIFEIFGCEKSYDLIITNKNINDILETPVYKIEKYPLESNFVDLKFNLLKNKN